MQDRDTYCHRVHQQLRKGKISNNQLYKVENDTLKRHLQIGEQVFYPIVLPHMLIGHVLELAHNKLGHNGISRTYAMLKRLYYWKGMKGFHNFLKVISLRICTPKLMHTYKKSNIGVYIFTNFTNIRILI